MTNWYVFLSFFEDTKERNDQGPTTKCKQMANVLVRSLYRKVLKRSDDIVAIQGGNSQNAITSAFGLVFTAPARLLTTPGEGRKPNASLQRQLVRYHFRRPITVGESLAQRLEAAFDSLQRIEGAVPNEEADRKYFVGEADLHIGNSERLPQWLTEVESFRPRVVLPASSGSEFPLNRHLVPCEPMHPVFLTNTWRKFCHVNSVLRQAVACVQLEAVQKSSVLNPAATNAELWQHVPTTTSCITNNVEVECRTEFVGIDNSSSYISGGDDEIEGIADHRERRASTHIFRYSIVIRNLHSPKDPTAPTIALLSRHWMFVDVDRSQVQEVVGPGVVGEFPALDPGSSHVYQSGTSLFSPRGIMKGTFQMVLVPRKSDAVEKTTAKIAQFDAHIEATALRGGAPK